MTESQNIEYKSVWRDEYLKWICGFANANGGKLFIGIDDKGQVAGVKDAMRLMEDIPNKVVQHLGLAVDANLVIKGNKQIIEIVVSPSSLPVSYHGVFHYRSGNTKQELKGAALNNFLLLKMGKTWDGISPENASIADIDPLAIKLFINKARESNRISQNVNTRPDLQIEILQSFSSKPVTSRSGVVGLQEFLIPANRPACLNLSWKNMPEEFR